MYSPILELYIDRRNPKPQRYLFKIRTGQNEALRRAFAPAHPVEAIAKERGLERAGSSWLKHPTVVLQAASES